MDVGTIYAGARARTIDLVAAVDPTVLEQTVPATPAWTGRQLLAHLVGVASDVLAQRFDMAGTDGWSARQVEERAGRSTAELVEEWQRTAADFDAAVGGQPLEGMVGALGVDIVQHEFDLRGLVGGPVPDDALDAMDPALNFMVGFLDRRVKKAGLAALHLHAGSQEWIVGPGESATAAAVTTTPLELFRVLAGRRSEAQIRALDWEGDPTPYFGVLSAFGPLPEADVVERFA